jgi:DNA-binding transcriptional LysR family regulator
MQNLDAISVFVKVVQAGSFTAAARALRMPNTTVSAKVASLERALGVTLLQRTTRKLSVTQAGEAYFRRCVRGLEEIEAAESEITHALTEPQGTLKVTAPVDIGHTLLPPLVQTYLRKYPKTSVELLVTNRVVDLVGEGVDVAIRAGELEDSTLIARKFVSARMDFFASPAYLKRMPAPKDPKELAEHAFLRFSEHPDLLTLHALEGKASVDVRLQGRVSVDDLETLKILAVRGEGIAAFPRFLAEDEIRKGKLVPVLPKWCGAMGHFSLVYPAQKFVSAKVQAFLDLAHGESRSPSVK